MMITVSAFVLAITGLLCFIAGQFYGDYRVTKKAKFMMTLMQKSMESYQKAMAHIITAKGLNYKQLEKEALEWTMSQTIEELGNKFKMMANGGDNDDDASQEDNKGSGSGGPSVH